MDSCYFGSMFDVFSMRARQVVFASRVKAGERGAKMLDVDDLLAGLVLEDQGSLIDVLAKLQLHGEPVSFAGSAESHIPFFPPKTAHDLLSSLDKLLPQSKPVALTTEVPVSPALRGVFDSAKALQSQFQYSHIEPLHLLAAILDEESSHGAKLLQGSGITREKVLRALDGPTDK
jgi:ATP-dependent Clp protease ATP-binding subunit ClpA